MSAILFLYKCRLVNWFKQALKKPGQLIFILLIGGSAFSMLFVPVSRDGADKAISIVDNGIDINAADIVIVVLWALSLLIFLSGIYAGAKKGAVVFSMADTQFLFTSPFKPQNVLIYGMANMMGTMLLTFFFFFYQIPNLRHVGFSIVQIVTTILLFVLVAIVAGILQQAVYLLCAKHERLRTLLRVGILALIAILLAVVASYFFLLQGQIKAFTAILSDSRFLLLVPLIGWAVQLMIFPLNVHNWAAVAALLLLIGTAIACLRFSYHTDADFYEEATESTVRRTELQARQKTAGSGIYIERKHKVRGKGIKYGSGESTIFFMHLMEQQRVRPFLVGFATLIYTIGGAVAAFSSRQAEAGQLIALFVFSGIAAYAMLFLSMDNPLIKDLNQPFFYYMPGKGFFKIMWASVIPLLYTAIDLLPAYLIILLVARPNPLHVLVMWLSVCSFTLIFLSGQLIVRRLLGTVEGTLASSLFFLMQIVILLPGAFLFVMGGVMGSTVSIFYAFLFPILALLLHCLIFGLTCLLGRRMLENGIEK